MRKEASMCSYANKKKLFNISFSPENIPFPRTIECMQNWGKNTMFSLCSEFLLQSLKDTRDADKSIIILSCSWKPDRKGEEWFENGIWAGGEMNIELNLREFFGIGYISVQVFTFGDWKSIPIGEMELTLSTDRKKNS